MSLLTSDEKELIDRAVKEAEASTGGEIVTAIIPESDDYALRELIAASAAALIAFIAMALFPSGLNQLADRLFWHDSPSLLPLMMLTLSLAVGALAFWIVQIPALDRFIVGRQVMSEAVHRRALRYFIECGAGDTLDRTGVLLFISVLERRVELIADKGINDRVVPDSWDRIVSSLVRGIGERRTASAIVTAVQEIGMVLSEHVPRRETDTNELNDGAVELGRKT
jgi:putative membrane protein